MAVLTTECPFFKTCVGQFHFTPERDLLKVASRLSLCLRAPSEKLRTEITRPALFSLSNQMLNQYLGLSKLKYSGKDQNSKSHQSRVSLLSVIAPTPLSINSTWGSGDNAADGKASGGSIQF